MNIMLSEKAKQLGEQLAFGFSNDDREIIVSTVSKREYFAGLAMQGVLASDTLISNLPKVEDVALFAIIYADALLEELSKEK